MDLLRPYTAYLQFNCYNFTCVPEDYGVAGQWHRLDAEASLKLVVLADISALRELQLNLNSLRPPAW